MTDQLALFMANMSLSVFSVIMFARAVALCRRARSYYTSANRSYDLARELCDKTAKMLGRAD